MVWVSIRNMRRGSSAFSSGSIEPTPARASDWRFAAISSRVTAGALGLTAWRVKARRFISRGRLPELNPAEFRHRFLDGPVLLDEGNHAVLGVIEFLRLLEDSRCARFWHHGNAVIVSNHDIARIDLNARALDGNVHALQPEVIDGRGRGN